MVKRQGGRQKGRVWLICVGLCGLLAVFGVSLEGCGCAMDTDCPSKLRCGAGGVCMYRCFPGERDACVVGFVCNATGDGCVAATPTTPDAGAND